jgi:UDPglucose 6-dehydrogenase
LVQFAVASNPEFLREGKAVEDFLKPDRVVVGARHQRAFNILEEMYRPITSVHGDFLKMSIRSAELAKYACNSMLATRVSFMNEFAELADTVGADILDVARVMGSDQRIGPHFLNAGVGFGGSCFPKDLKATIHLASSVGRSMPILSSVCQVNDFQHLTLIERAKSLLGDLNGKRIAIWGLSFKPETDDTREAPSVSVIRRLLMQGASVRAHDPKVRWLPLLSSMDQSSFSIHDDKLEAAEGSDVLMLITEWNEYRDVDLGIVTGLMRTPIVLDGRNLWSENLHDSDKYSYFGVGRGESATHHSSQRELAG